MEDPVIETAIQGIEGDPLVYLNGHLTPLSGAKVSVLDRAFIFGDGIYEVVPVYHGKPFRMEGHLNRLERSLGELRIENPLSRERWVALVDQMIVTQMTDTQMIYLQVSRGVAKRDHAFPVPTVKPTVFAMSLPLTPPSEVQRMEGLKAVVLNDERWLRCDIKSVSLLGNVLARQYATDHGAHEVVMFRDNLLTEGSSSNIWVVKQGRLLAPPKDHKILQGIRYGILVELAERLGVPFEARPITKEEVLAADELMLSSATREVLAITLLDGRGVGTGCPGPVFNQLRAAYDAEIAKLAGPST